MSLQEKYGSLIDQAKSLGTSNLNIVEQNGVLHIDGTVPNGTAKDQLWNTYDSIDPNFQGGDLVLDIKVDPAAPGTRLKVTTQSSNLNIRKGPGLDQPVIGKAAHESTVTLLTDYNSEWALVRSEEGVEGYCSRQYLTQI